MGIIFISHSSLDNTRAIQVRDWLRENGWHDTFLDLDPARGLAPGQRWQEELKKAGERCSAVVVLISPAWLASKWCQVEFLLASQLGKRIFAVVVSPTALDDLPIELTAHYQIADISAPVTAGDGFARLRWGLKRAGLDPTDFPWPPPNQPRRNPYRGLRNLEETDAGIFFGREAATTRGLDTLRRMRDGAPERLLVVLGASGAGKSSFLKAGLLARLARDEEHFLVLPTVRPSRAALTGPDGLLHALGVPSVPNRDALTSRLTALRAPILERFERFAAAARERHQTKAPTVVVAIDQAEELFGSDNSESPSFFDLLRALLETDDNLAIVLTIRTDSYAGLQGERRLADVPRLPFDLPPLSPSAFRQVIEGPGRLNQPAIVFEPALTDRLVADLDQADALPLLASTLERLVADYGTDCKLELVEYEQGLGGLAGAIDKAVEAAFASATADHSLPPDRASLEVLARRAFIPWLVKVDDAGGVAKRRVAAIEELPEETRTLVRHFVNQRLLLSDMRAGGDVLEVSHESVLRHWPGLSRWVDEERGCLIALDVVRGAASEWQRHVTAGPTGSSDEWLVHRGERLLQGEALLQRADYARLLTGEGVAYLSACRSREEAARADADARVRQEQEQMARQRRLQRRVAVALALFGVVTLAFSGFAVVQSRAASRETSIVLTNYAQRAIADGLPERAARFAVLAAWEGPLTVADPAAAATLAAAADRSSLVQSFSGHVGAVAWAESSDGERLLSWGGDGTARVWDASSGREIARQTHTGTLGGAVFSPDGRSVLSWDGDGTVRVWEATSGRELAHQKHAGGVTAAALSADGRRVLSWGADKTIRVWDAVSGRETATRSYEAGVEGAVLAPDGTRALSWGRDEQEACLWDAASGRDIACDDHLTSNAVLSPAGRRVLSWWVVDPPRVWDATSGMVFPKQSEAVVGGIFSANGTRTLSWSAQGTARVSDSVSGKEISHRTHQDWVVGGVFSADGGRVLSWSRDDTVFVWDATSGRDIARHKHDGRVLNAVFSADGRRVLSWAGDGTVRVWEATSGVENARRTFADGVGGSAFTANGAQVLSWAADGTAELWNPKGRDEIAKVAHDAIIGDAALTADGERLLSWSGVDRTARVWNIKSGLEIARQTHVGRIEGALFAPDERRVLSWSDDGQAVVWDAASGGEIARQKHGGRIGGAAFSSDGRRVLSWSDDATARVWDAASGQEVARQTHPGQIDGADFDDHSRRVLSWSSDGTARVWDATSGREIARQKHEGRIRAAAFDTPGQRVLSWGEDGTARIWDAGSGREIARQTQEDGISYARFAPDGARVVSWNGVTGVAWLWDVGWGIYGTIRVWDVSWSVPRGSNGSLIKDVCGRTLRASVRRITSADALAAPLLRDRVGQDVCGASSFRDVNR